MESPTSLRLAITLFERGFEEDRIQAALQHCSTLEDAVAWLSSRSSSSDAGASAGAVESSQSGSHGAAAVAEAGVAPAEFKALDPPARPVKRRRAWRKIGDAGSGVAASSAVAPKAEVPAAAAVDEVIATPAHAATPALAAAVAPATVTVAVATVAAPASPVANSFEDSLPSASISGSPAGTAASTGASPSSTAGLARGATEASSPPVLGIAAAAALPIEPRDASAWWRDAAARWPAIAAGLRKQARAGVRQLPPPPLQKEGRPLAQPPSRDDAEAAETASASVSQRKRPHTDAPVDVDGATTAALKRPPATPCSAEPQQRQQQPDVEIVAWPCSPRRSPMKAAMTPRSSPRAMRINNQAETCGICCNDVPPWRAVRLSCGHGWYCAQCILRHAEARLAVGAASVTCPECNAALAERDLRKLLPPELIDRLLARSLEQAISSAADLWACPTPNCPMRVALGDGELPRLRCTLCKKDSCLRCGFQPYHKGLTCEEHAERMREKGRRKQRDEDSLMQWLKETGTKQCPTCRIAVSKQNLNNQQTQYSECHKMFCRNCNTKFCFKCLAVLTDTYSCGCTISAHGFINPHTGKRINHLRRGRAGMGAKGKAGHRG